MVSIGPSATTIKSVKRKRNEAGKLDYKIARGSVSRKEKVVDLKIEVGGNWSFLK